MSLRLRSGGSSKSLEGASTFNFQILEQLPVNAMAADADLNLVYINRHAKQTLQGLDAEIRRMFKIGSAELLGGSIHRMHSDPARVERILRDPKSFPHHALLKFGTVTLSATFDMIRDEAGTLLGYGVVWESVGAKMQQAQEATHDLAEASSSVAAAAVELAASSAETNSQVMTVASGAEQMSASVAEIARHVSQVSATANRGVQVADSVNATMVDLGVSSDEIGGLVGLIASIADQTNLLALNATIEAARAGDAGKGFAVVAGEVKTLAQQAATATSEIRAQVTAIQSKVSSAELSLQEMLTVVGEISDLQTGISAAIEEQAATSSEIARSIQIVAGSAQNITDVAESFTEMSSLLDRRTTEVRELLN